MNTELHRVLLRQVTKYVGGVEAIPKSCLGLLGAINDTYVHFDEDRLLIERSLELSSKELSEYISLIKSTLDSTDNGILVVKNDGKSEVYNRKFAEMWGIPEDVLNTRDDDKMLGYVLPQLKMPDAFLNKVKELYGRPDAESYDILEFKDGRTFERYSQPQRIGDKVVGRVWNFRDITDRKKAEDELRESEQRQKDVVEFFPDAILAVDKDKCVVIWNKAIEKMSGVLAKDMIGKGDYAYTISFYGEARPQLMDLVFEDEAEIISKYPGIKKEGGSVSAEVFCNALYGNKGAWVFAKAAPLHDKDGNIVGAIEVIRDITERKNAEEALKISEDRYRELFNNAADIIVIVDTKGNFIELNNKFVEESGWSREEMIGKSVVTSGIVTFESGTKIAYYLSQILAGKDAPLFEVTGIVKGGDKIPYELRAVPLRSGGKLVAIQAILRNVSERKKTEQDLKMHIDEIERMNKFMVNREVKMVELKKEIEDLKIKLEKK